MATDPTAETAPETPADASEAPPAAAASTAADAPDATAEAPAATPEAPAATPEVRTLERVLDELEEEAALRGRKHPRARNLASEARRHPNSDGYVEALIVERSDRGEEAGRKLAALDRAVRAQGPEGADAKRRFDEVVAAHPNLRALAEQKLAGAPPKPAAPARPSEPAKPPRTSEPPKREPKPEPAPKTRPLPQLLRDLENVVSRYSRDDARVLAAVEAVRTAKDAGPDVEADIAEHTRRGEDIGQRLAALDAAVAAHGVEGEETKRTADEVLAAYPFLKGPIDKRLGVPRTEKPRPARPVEAPPEPRDHRIDALGARPKWTLHVERGGADPTRAVALLLPRSPHLRGLPRGWRAADMVGPALDAVIDAVIADRSAGVLGLSQLPAPAKDRGAEHGAPDPAVIDLVAWVARLLALEGPTDLDVVVDGQGEQAAGAWRSAFGELQRALAEHDPKRASQLAIRAKLGRRDESPFHGYVDALAHLWTSPREDAPQRLARSGLAGVCLHDGRGEAARAGWDQLARGREPDAATLQALVADPTAELEGSLAHGVLARVAARCRDDEAARLRLLDRARAELDSKSVDVLAVGRELAWLIGQVPAAAPLAGRLELAALTARLAAEGRAGALLDETRAAWDALAGRLFEEDANLIAHASLARAAVHAELGDVDGAAQSVARFRDVAPEVPGLRLFAQLRRALGTLAAAQGERGEAVRWFDEAKAASERLSDAAVADEEVRSTASERAKAGV